MNTHNASSYWSVMTDDEQQQVLQMIVQYRKKMVREFRNMMRRALATDPEGADEPAWRQAELVDAYQSEVWRGLGRADEQLWEGGAEPDDDPLDAVAQHCHAGYERGWSAAHCAGQWRCEPG